MQVHPNALFWLAFNYINVYQKRKKKSRINRYCISSKNFNQLTKFFELFENVNLSKVIALYYF